MKNRLNKIITNLIFIFISLLSIQTVWIVKEAMLNNFKWQYGTVSIYITEFLLFLILVVALFILIQRYRDHQLNISKTLIMILAIPFLLLLWSGLLIVSSSNSLVASSAWVKFSEAVLLFSVLIAINYSRKKIAWSFIIGGLLQSIFAIYNFLFQEVIAIKWLGISAHSVTDLTTFNISTGPELWLRSYGGFSHPNILGGFLVVSILISLWLYLTTTSRWAKIFLVVSFIIMSLGLFFSFSRSAFIALGLAFAVWLVGAMFNRNFWRTAKPIAYIILIFTVLSAIYQPLVVARIFGIGNLENKSIEQRIDSFSQSIEMIDNSWLWPVGMGNYTFALYLDNPDLNGWEYQPVHNIYLLILSELGLIGFILFILFIAMILYYTGINFQKDPFYLALLVAILVIGLLDHYLWTSYFGIVLFWLVLYIATYRDNTADNVSLDWDRASSEYSSFIGQEGDFVRQALINPYLSGQLDNISGTDILDLGCGEGYLARLFTSRGLNFTGVDVSQELLAEARKKQTPGVLIWSDICDDNYLVGKTFDVIIINMVMMDVINISSVYRNAFRLLASNGKLIVTILHPVSGRPAGRWFKTWSQKILRQDPFIRLDSYGQEFKREESIIGLSNLTRVYHRSISTYIQSGIDIGFELSNVSDLIPSVYDLQVFGQPKFLHKYPMVLALTFMKK